MILKKDQYGIFWSCSGFPSCRHSENYSIEQEPAMTCPICRESEIITKRTPTGKPFYVCPEPDCEFMAWSKPRPLPCQVCGSAYLVEKKSAAGKKHLRCPKAGCNYMQALPGEDGMDLLVEPPKSAEPVRKKVRVVRRAQGSAAGGTRKVKLVRRRK
jgi:DNA topoisomerase-1